MNRMLTRLIAPFAASLLAAGALAMSTTDRFGNDQTEAPQVSTTDIQPQNRDYTRPEDEVLRKSLTPLQYRVTQKDATEPAFDNPYWNEKRTPG